MSIVATGTSTIIRWLDAINPFGAVFAKELWLTCRRKRHYGLRSVYVMVMAGVVISAWFGTISVGGAISGKVYQAARMSEVGVTLVVTIGFFQFFALQIIAPVLTGTSISSEIKRRTLGTLMLTAISSVQIVAGKLASEMLTVLLLVGTSLPLLAIIRVFGGVEWGLVLAIEGLTICAALFAAALSLTFSSMFGHKETERAAGTTYAVLLLIYLLIPGAAAAICEWRLVGGGPEEIFSYFNPFVSLLSVVQETYSPGGGSFTGWSSPPVQCGLLLAATLILIMVSSLWVRRVGLRIAGGEPPGRPLRRYARAGGSSGGVALSTSVAAGAGIGGSSVIREVSDRPVLWREWQAGIFSSRRRRNLAVGIVLAALVIIHVTFWIYLDCLADPGYQIVWTEVFLLLALARAAMIPATTIAREKESSTWEGLILTALTPREILHDKAKGIVPRVAPFAGLYLGHIIVFVVLGMLNPLAAVHAVLILVGPFIFLVCSGTYFSLRCKRTKNAVMLNQGLALGLWFFPWTCCGPAFMFSTPLAVILALANPLVLDGISIAWAAGDSVMPASFPWREIGPAEFTGILMLVSMVYFLMGYLMLRLGIRNFHRYCTQ